MISSGGYILRTLLAKSRSSSKHLTCCPLHRIIDRNLTGMKLMSICNCKVPCRIHGDFYPPRYLHVVPDPSHWYVSPFALRFWFSIPCLHRATYLFSFLHVNRPLSISSLVRLLSIDLKLVVYSSFFVCESERVNYQSVSFSSSIWVQEPFFRYLDSMSCACHSSFINELCLSFFFHLPLFWSCPNRFVAAVELSSRVFITSVHSSGFVHFYTECGGRQSIGVSSLVGFFLDISWFTCLSLSQCRVVLCSSPCSPFEFASLFVTFLCSRVSVLLSFECSLIVVCTK